MNRAQVENDNPRIATVSSSSTKRDALRLSAIYRDPHDVRTVIHLARSGIVLTVLLLISIAGNFYQYHRRPDRIVVDKSSGRVVEINDRKQDNILDKQLQESWQGTWTAQDITVDSKDRYTIRVLGRQDIHRLDNGVTLDEPRQLSLSLKLIADPKGRAAAISAQASSFPALITKNPVNFRKDTTMDSSKAATILTLLTILACPALAVAQDSKRDTQEEEGIAVAPVSRQPPA